MGTPAFAVPSLNALLAHGENIVAVVTQPDRPSGRGRKLAPPPVKEVALQAAIPVLQPQKIKGEDFLARLRSFLPDLIVVAAFGRILPGHLLHMPPLGTINVHGSLLPKYRGAAPVQWALLKGETTTGITIMQMDEGLDTGDILFTEKIAIDPEDTAGSLMVKLAELGGHALVKAIDLLREGKIVRIKQDNSLATLAPPLSKDMGRINWTESAAAISRLIRGLDPWPATYTMAEGTRMRLFAPKVIDSPAECKSIEQHLTERGMAIAPGTICLTGQEGLVIATGSKFLLIREVQPEGGRRMTVDSYLRGHPLKEGQVIG